jgi:hypothetical protein
MEPTMLAVRSLLVAFACVIPIAPSLRAQGAADQAAVKRAVLDYVEGFYEGDTAKLTRSVWPEVRKYGYWRNEPAGPYSGSAMAYSAFLTYALDTKAGKRKTPEGAPKDVVIFEVQDQTANAKVTAWWGTDYILLAKEKGRWMITHVLWQGPLKK